MRNTTYDLARHSTDPEYLMLMQRARVMNNRGQQILNELMAMRARVRLALESADAAVHRANATLQDATNYLVAAQIYCASNSCAHLRRTTGASPGPPGAVI